jgi:hypothetical protein
MFRCSAVQMAVKQEHMSGMDGYISGALIRIDKHSRVLSRIRVDG